MGSQHRLWPSPYLCCCYPGSCQLGGQSDGMVTHVKLPPCYGLSKRPKRELIEELVLLRGPLWKNVHFIEWTSDQIHQNRAGQPLCQELPINLGSRMKYTHVGLEFTPPLMVMACTPGWENYLMMINHLMDEEDEDDLASREDTATTKNDATPITVLPSMMTQS